MVIQTLGDYFSTGSAKTQQPTHIKHYLATNMIVPRLLEEHLLCMLLMKPGSFKTMVHWCIFLFSIFILCFKGDEW